MDANGYAEHNKAFAKLVRRLGYDRVADNIVEWRVHVCEEFRRSPEQDLYLRFRFGEGINYRHRQFLTVALEKGPRQITKLAGFKKDKLEKLIRDAVREKLRTDLIELPSFM